MKRRPAVDLAGGGSMIRVEEEESEELDDENAMDDEEEEDEEEEELDDDDDREDTGSVNQEDPGPADHNAVGQSSAQRHRHPQEHQLSVPAALLTPSGGPRGRRFGRRASSAMLEAGKLGGSTPIVSAQPAAGDKALRPHFLKERSATLMDLTGGKERDNGGGGRANGYPGAEAPPAPQSKASAFLLGVLAKSRALNSGSSRRSGPGGGAALSNSTRATATAHSTNHAHAGKDVGQQLRSPSSRRAGRALSPFSLGCEDQVLEGSSVCRSGKVRGDEGSPGPQSKGETPAELVAEMRRHRQQLAEQLAVLARIHGRLQDLDEADEREHLPLCAAFVDAGLVAEAAAAMREFRFHAHLHIGAINVLAVLASASSVYAYMMVEVGVESILQKSVAVHASHDRLIMAASSLLHTLEEAKTSANAHVVRRAKTAKDAQRANFFADLALAQLGLSSSRRGRRQRPRAAPSRDLGANCIAFAPSKQPLVPPLFSKRAVSSPHSASRLRQMLTESLAPPPKLTAHYDLVAASLALAASTLPPPEGSSKGVQASVASDSPRPEGARAGRPRPGTSPVKRSLSLDLKALSSSRSAASAYGDRVVFVEPSPLHKRLPLRGGTLSAGGVRRRLSARRYAGKRLDALTLRVSMDDAAVSLDCGAGAATSLRAATLVPSSAAPCAPMMLERSPENAVAADSGSGASLSESQRGISVDSSRDTTTADCGEGDEDEDESYDDDFSPPDEDPVGAEEETNAAEGRDLPACGELGRVESDNELMDMMLADLMTQEVPRQHVQEQPLHQTSACATDTAAASAAEAEAATCIQRHVRGASARRRVAAKRGSETRPRPMTDHDEPRSEAMESAVLGRRRRESRAKSLAVGETRSASLKRSAVARGAESLQRSRSQSPLPSPVAITSRSRASASLAPAHSTRPRGRSPTPASRLLPRAAAAAAASRPSVHTIIPPIKRRSASASAADVGRRVKGAGRLGLQSDGDLHGVDPAPAASASPVVEASAVGADALFGGPDPLRKLQDLYAEGLRLHRAGRVAEAAVSYEAALALAPATGRGFASVHLNLGSARMALGDLSAALADFREARRVQPTSAKAAFNEALALLRLGRRREATRALREVLRLEPTHERAREALARVEGDAGAESFS